MVTVSVESVGINDAGRWFISFSDQNTLEFGSEEDYVAYCSGLSLDYSVSEFMRRLCASMFFNDSTNLGRVITFDVHEPNGNIVKG